MRIYTMLTGLMETNCYLVVTKERHIAVIDPGADPETIIAKLEDLGSEPSMILLTHAHYDHTGAVEALCKRYPDCPVMLGEKELPVYGDPNLSLAPMLGSPKEPQKLRYDRLLHEGDTIQLDELTFTVLETPGHTPGGVCYQVGDVIFSGDTLFQLSVGRTDFPGGDAAALKKSVQRLRDLPGEYTICPGHGSPTYLSQERSKNPYMRG